MEMSKSDVLDKYSILAMKTRYDAALLPMFREYGTAAVKILTKGKKDKSLIHAFVTLIEANAKIWALEATIRNEFSADPANQGTELTLEAIGRAALSIRAHNALRIEAKNDIDRFFGDTPEFKVNHMSSEEKKIYAK